MPSPDEPKETRAAFETDPSRRRMLRESVAAWRSQVSLDSEDRTTPAKASSLIIESPTVTTYRYPASMSSAKPSVAPPHTRKHRRSGGLVSWVSRSCMKWRFVPPARRMSECGTPA